MSTKTETELKAFCMNKSS